MGRSELKYNILNESEIKAIKLNNIQKGRLANTLFTLGCFIIFIEFDDAEKALLQPKSNAMGKNIASNNELSAAKLAVLSSTLFAVAEAIITIIAMIKIILEIDASKSDSGTQANKIQMQGLRIIALSATLKTIGYIGATIGFYIVAQELENSQ